jgi:putative transposase
LAGQVLLKIVYALTCRILGLVVVLFRSDPAAVAEMLVLRHENAVLRRQVGRVRYEPADRVWFAALARIVSRRRWAEVFPVTPATLLARPPSGNPARRGHRSGAAPRQPHLAAIPARPGRLDPRRRFPARRHR